MRRRSASFAAVTPVSIAAAFSYKYIPHTRMHIDTRAGYSYARMTAYANAYRRARARTGGGGAGGWRARALRRRLAADTVMHSHIITAAREFLQVQLREHGVGRPHLRVVT